MVAEDLITRIYVTLWTQNIALNVTNSKDFMSCISYCFKVAKLDENLIVIL